MKIHDANNLCDWRIIYRLGGFPDSIYKRITCKRCLRRKRKRKRKPQAGK